MSSAHLSKSLPLPRPRMDDFVLGCNKPGIVSILGCGPGTANKASPSLRRTLSADMSRKWLEQNGFCPVKKADEVSSSSDDEEDTLKKDVEGCRGRVYIWKSTKESGKDVGSEEPSVCNNTWGSILFQKVEDSKSLPPPYTHPLVKRSKSTLSTQSLEICTESLGSETGSDGFSSYSASEVGDMEFEDGVLSQDAVFDVEEFYEVKYAALAARKTTPRTFPPPIHILSQGNGGGSLSMYSCRDNGRLVLEAVSIPSEKNFEARREDGRLVLTLATNDQTCRKDEEEIDEEENNELGMEMDEDNFEEMEIGTAEFASESIRELCSRGMINVQKLATLLNEPATSLYRDSAWLGKYYESFNYEEDEEEKRILLEQSLSTPLTVTASASLNAYEYLWGKKLSATTSIATTVKAHSSNNVNDAWESRLLRERDGCSAPLLQGCNSPSRTNLLLELSYRLLSIKCYYSFMFFLRRISTNSVFCNEN